MPGLRHAARNALKCAPIFLEIEHACRLAEQFQDEPDFIAVVSDGTHYLIETKGMEDVNVANKDRAAILWCDNATQLTGTPWSYVKVRQEEYKSLQPTRFSDLIALIV